MKKWTLLSADVKEAY